MLILNKCTVIPDDADSAGVLGDVDEDVQGKLRLVHTGSTVTISSREKGRYRALDQLTRATVAESRGGGYQIDGVSQFLTGVINLPPDDARVSLHVTGTDGCASCH